MLTASDEKIYISGTVSQQKTLESFYFIFFKLTGKRRRVLGSAALFFRNFQFEGPFFTARLPHFLRHDSTAFCCKNGPIFIQS